MKEFSSARRRFLEVVGGVTLCGSVGCAADPESGDPEPIGDVAAGNIADLAVGELRSVEALPVSIGRDDQGVYAMTLTCSHAGCNMATEGSVSFDEVYCACHGSRFTGYGDVTRGPARRALVHYEVEIAGDGSMTIHGDSQVAADTRSLSPTA